MSLIEKETNTLTTSIRKKKKNKEDKKSIFDIYRSKKTLKDYFYYLNGFLNYVYEGEGEIQPEEIIKLMSEIEKDDIDDYLAYLINDKKLKKTSVNTILSGLKSLFKELEKNGYSNPSRHTQLFKTTRNLDNILKLSYGDIKEILEKYRVYGDKSYRNIIILQMLFYTGMRSSELINLKFKHILKRDEEYFIKLETTKSGKEQYKPMHEFLVKKMSDYKNYVKNMFLIEDEELEESYIFPACFEKNIKISYNALYSLIQEMGKIINKNISPHNIRHAIATELSINGADILEIRDFLGHSDTKVTEIYINAKTILEKRVLERIPVPNLEE
ncbi:MAG: tyrosine-type recombinase/integrase [Fusobacteriaceae bacterium]